MSYSIFNISLLSEFGVLLNYDVLEQKSLIVLKLKLELRSLKRVYHCVKSVPYGVLSSPYFPGLRPGKTP